MSALFEPITAHCFWACGHTVTTLSPDETHAQMEAHYETAHRRDLDLLLAPLRIRPGLIEASR